jgi:DNA-binding IclR family transcriptional regulator
VETREPAASVRIQSVDRAVDLLLAVAAAQPERATVPALARTCGLNRATAWRLLKTLQARRMVTVDESGRYALGVTAVELGGAAGPGMISPEQAARSTGAASPRKRIYISTALPSRS